MSSLFHRLHLPIIHVVLLSSIFSALAIPFPSQVSLKSTNKVNNNTTVLILGGGVSGVIAARTFHEQGLDNFIVVEARPELGGRLQSKSFGSSGVGPGEYEIELGANWVHGAEDELNGVNGKGKINPIWDLAKKWGVKTNFSDYYGSMTTYDYTGPTNYLDVFNRSIQAYATLTAAAGSRLKDSTARTGYSLTGWKPKTHHEIAAEYYVFDWEYAQAPEMTSWLRSAASNNYTYEPSSGGFSPVNQFSIDQRGFKTFIQSEAESFLQPHQLLLNSTVTNIKYKSEDGLDLRGVEVTLEDGRLLKADYALVTFSLGVLQNDDVVFEPELPEWKREAIMSMNMATFTKIFMQFPHKFWFDTQFGLYADYERGRYPVWQSLDMPGFFPGSGILFATVTGDYALRIESLPSTLIQNELLSVLRSMFPDVDIPEPTAFYFPRWHEDKLFRGSYSNWPATFVREQHVNLRKRVGERVWFAGEHTSEKWYGFLHGAYNEGKDIAADMVRCITGLGCVEPQYFE